jgi:hypothetical protein
MPAKYTLAPYSRKFVGQNRTCALCEGRRGHDDQLNVLLTFLDNPLILFGNSTNPRDKILAGAGGAWLGGRLEIFFQK